MTVRLRRGWHRTLKQSSFLHCAAGQRLSALAPMEQSSVRYSGDMTRRIRDENSVSAFIFACGCVSVSVHVCVYLHVCVHDSVCVGVCNCMYMCCVCVYFHMSLHA